MEKNLLGWFFGKKKSGKKLAAQTEDKRVKPSKMVMKEAKKYRIKLTLKKGSKRVWKSEKMLLKQIKKAKKSVKKSVKKSRKLSRFGSVGGRYMPLSNILSPYPRSVNSGSPFL